tara:strand:- start:637 stop:2121 length:1485 start_codon:yes stop_codon:yes gene_type:complete
MGVIEVKYFNSFVLRKVLETDNANAAPGWGGSRGDNTYPQIVSAPNVPLVDVRNWSIEEARIRGEFNGVNIEYGVKAYLVEDNPNGSIRGNSMIYSGIFNSRTGINDLNVFSVGEDITKSVSPANGSIQRLYAEDSNLIIFQEAKVSRALIDKDAIYSAEGGGTVTSSNLVIGDVRAFQGNFGISKNPESFAAYGYQKYFTDKDRGVVLRLSSDGLTEISKYGMYDFFRDRLSTLNETPSTPGKAVGAWDTHNKQYVLSLQPKEASFSTVSYDDDVKGFPSLFSYKPDQGVSIKNNYYTMKDGVLYIHYANTAKRGNFYGTPYKSSVTFLFNPKVSMSKVFKTVNYEGSNGWQIDSFISDVTGLASVGTPEEAQNDPFAFGTTDSVGSVDANGNRLPIKVYSFNQGSYDNLGNQYPAQMTPPINHAGFNRKENKYMANLVNNSYANAGEVIWGAAITGIKGYFATVTISTDSVTDWQGPKELFAVSSDYVESSY